MEFFEMRGAVKDYLWGGTALRDEYGVESDKERLAEAWLLSCHKNGASVVRNGEYAGVTLHQLVTEHPEYLGTRHADGDDFPVLIKLIDAKEDLSVQVHPDDDYAREVENGRGKMELWYVVDCDENAKVICGFSDDMTAEEFRQAALNGTVTEHVNSYNVKKGDVFFVEPGTLHAIGKGTLIAEIQQNSDITYRVYDYGRTDAQGNARPLHIDKAMDVVITAPPLTEPGAEGEPEQYGTMTRQLLADCESFTTWLYETDAAGTLEVGEESFACVLVTDGEITLAGQDSTAEIKKGGCVFIPADFGQVKISGKGKFLVTTI